MNKFPGFTLVEYMIIVAVIAILVAMAIPAYQQYMEGSKTDSEAAVEPITEDPQSPRK